MSSNNVYGSRGQKVFNAYDAEGVWRPEVYDIYKEPYTLITINPDNSVGTDSGYALEGRLGNTYIMRTMVNILPDGDAQAFAYNPDNGKYYRFAATTNVVYYDSSLAREGTITAPSSLGHTNGACYLGGLFYFPNLDPSNIITWSPTENVVGSLPIVGITQPTNGSSRNCDAVCRNGKGGLYLICRDSRASELVHQNGDMLSVYDYDLETNEAVLVAEFPWDCVYIQGATMYDGILYVACNTQTTGAANNYKGATIKVIRTDTWTLIDELICEGDFEPEGADIVPTPQGDEIEVVFAHWGTLCLVLRFTPPYSLN